MKKRGSNRNIKVLNFFDKNEFGSIPRIFISSLILIFFFYSMPIFVSFVNKDNLEFQNNSKAVLAYTLNSKNNSAEEKTELLDEKDLLVDIFSLNELEVDTVRLNASTIKQLFEDTKYTLEDVREKKLVKPVALTLLPNEIKMIESTKKRKEFFIQIVLPLILKENNNIRIDRKRLFSIINKSNNSDLEKKWLAKKYKQNRDPWPLNSFAIKAGIDLLSNKKFYEQWTKQIHSWINLEKKRVFEKLSKIENLKVHNSSTNFFLIEGKTSLTPNIKYLENKGILLRECNSFRFLDEKWARISLQNKKNNTLLCKEIQNSFKK